MKTIAIPDQIIQEISANLNKDGIEKVVAGAVIFFPDGNILLLERTPTEFLGGLVELPSGTIETGETILEGLAREVTEETGLVVESIDRYIGHFDYQSSSGKKTRQLNFAVTVKPGNVTTNPSEHSHFHVINPASNKLQEFNISEHTRNIIQLSIKR